ncbi:FMN-binding negative transcriptional regulator [Oxalobacteraceae bacterium OM1]|nr:FMN-binding negative transcriptional regulator [Oxalobacteraceae bacterium OM1]
MYLPSHFEETRHAVLHDLIARHPLGTLVTFDGEALNANHVPFELDADAGEHGTLIAHVARANPVWRQIEAGVEPLVVFQGAQTYVSPGWYPSKAEHGKVVPTYNYMVVHAYGHGRTVEDPVRLRAILTRLTTRHEAGMAKPWRIEDAPEDYIEKMLAAIVGIEIPIRRVVGKWKVSQNRPAADRAGVEQGLLGLGGEDGLAMAEAVRKGGG